MKIKRKVYRFNDRGELKDFENWFINKYSKYQIIQTNYSIIYQTDFERFLFNKSYLGAGGLNLIIQNKIHILKNIKEKEIEIFDTKPRYFTFNKFHFKNENGEINDLAELDINSAYIQSAFNQGFISEIWFNKLKSISKPMRLKVLGSIATRKNITEVENGQKRQYMKFDQILTNVWNMICRGCDKMIFDAVIDNRSKMFLFYWFDNLFMLVKTGDILYIDQNLFKINYGLDLDYRYIGKHLSIYIKQTQKKFIIPNL
jgi:hypothetical protein